MGLHLGALCLQSLISECLWSRIQSIQVDPSKPTTEKDVPNFLNAQSGELMTSIPASFFTGFVGRSCVSF